MVNFQIAATVAADPAPAPSFLRIEPGTNLGRIGRTFNGGNLAVAGNQPCHRNFAAPARIDLEAQALHEVVREHPVVGAGEAGLGEHPRHQARLVGDEVSVDRDQFEARPFLPTAPNMLGTCHSTGRGGPRSLYKKHASRLSCRTAEQASGH